MQIFPIFAAAFENFSFTNPLFTMKTVIWGILLGVGVGVVAAVCIRRTLGTFVKRLHTALACAPESAVSLEEIGMAKNPILQLALGEGKPLRKYALCANPEACVLKRPAPTGFTRAMRRVFSLEESLPPRVDLSRARFYMPDEQRYEAEVRYEKKGTDPAGMIVALLLLFALGCVVQWLLPALLSFLDRAISAMR